MDHATVHTVGGGKVLRGAAFLTLPWMARRLIRRLRPDVIDIHGVSSYGGYCFSPISDIPVCATVYGSDVTAHAATSRVGRVIANRCLQKADLIYASSPVAKKDILDTLNIDVGDRFVSRSWGIEMQSIQSLKKSDRVSERARLGIPTDAVVAIHNRQYRDFWHVDSLLEIAIQFCADGTGYFLFVCPKGDSIAFEKAMRAEKRVNAVGLGDRVRFIHDVNHHDMLRIFNASDLYTCFGDADLLSSSVLEAMALGLIPVVRNLPAYREVIRDGHNGYLHDELDHSRVLRQMREIASSIESYREIFSVSNRKLIADNYDARICSRWMVDRYHELKQRNTKSTEVLVG